MWQRRNLCARCCLIRLKFDWKTAFPEVIGRSEPMKKVLETIAKMARSDGSVLITGESGTGKELVASAIHRLSNRAGGRFVPLNCSAIPENLLESELFGHERGAFTGAHQKRTGHFELASGGSLFLDEIGDMTSRLQSKLLRVLQDKQFTAVGSSTLKKSRCASHCGHHCRSQPCGGKRRLQARSFLPAERAADHAAGFKRPP